MPARIFCRLLAFALALGLPSDWGIDCRAAGLYSVTDLGPDSYSNSQFEARAQHPSLGLTLSVAEKTALPSVTALQRPGVPGPQDISIQMTALQNTESGIVLGIAPVGILYSSPSFTDHAFGYTQKQADGTFGPFVPLAIENAPYPYNTKAWVDARGYIREADGTGQRVPLVIANGSFPLYGMASLDARGHILITNGFGQNLIDVNTGTTTDLTTLLPLGTLGPGGLYGNISRASMTADGTIFANVFSNTAKFPDGSYEHVLMLTPPLSTPEPSTLAGFAFLAVGLAVTRRRSKV